MSARAAFRSPHWSRFAAVALLALAAVVSVEGGYASPWREGVVAPTDLLAPVDLQVTPWVSSELVATRDGQLLPAVARFEAGLAEGAEREFNAAFARARTAFLDALEPAFGARVIDAARVGSLRFQSFRSEFVAAHQEFPVGYVLAASWAQGDDGEVVRARLAGVLRQVLMHRLIGTMPRNATVFAVALPHNTLVRAWSEASAGLLRAVDGADVVSLEAARAELWKNLGVGERFAGGYLETLVRENISFDARLTALFLHERLGAGLEGRFFGRGEVIATGGEPVDAVAAEALEQLESLGVAPLMSVSAAAIVATPVAVEPAPAAEAPPPTFPTVPDVEPVLAPAAAPPVATPPQALLPRGWMLAMAALGVLSFGLGAWVFVKLRRLRGTSNVLGRGPAGAGLREALAPHLAREITRQGMDALYSQRQELLATTAVATERVAELETRVAKVQPAIQERMQGYERRIKALERELQEK